MLLLFDILGKAENVIKRLHVAVHDELLESARIRCTKDGSGTSKIASTAQASLRKALGLALRRSRDEPHTPLPCRSLRLQPQAGHSRTLPDGRGTPRSAGNVRNGWLKNQSDEKDRSEHS